MKRQAIRILCSVIIVVAALLAGATPPFCRRILA